MASTPHLSQPDTVVLVLHPDADRREQIRCALESPELQVLEAGDTDHARRLIDETKTSILIAELELPDGPLSALASELRSRAETQQIAIAGVQRDENRPRAEAALEAGVDHILTPPITEHQLRLLVSALRRLHASRVEAQRSSDRRAELTRSLLVFVDLYAETHATEGLTEIIDHVVNAAVGLTQSRCAGVLLSTLSGAQLAVAAAIGDRFGATGARLTIDQSPFREAFLAGGPMVVSQGEDDASVYVPLLAHESGETRRLGVLYVGDRVGTTGYAESDVEFLQMLGDRAAAAYQHAVSRFRKDQVRDALLRSMVTLTEQRDDITGWHLERVTNYAIMLAEELRKHDDLEPILDDGYLRSLQWAVPLHDVGKVAIPDTILLKPGPLTQEEREIMQTHAAVGADTLRAACQGLMEADSLRMAEAIARHHHEWFDGRGYPDGLSGDDIPLCARIVALADVYDAVTTRRSYKSAMSHEAARKLIADARGTQFDPRVVDAFFSRQDEFEECAAHYCDGSQVERTAPPSLSAPSTLPTWLLSDDPEAAQAPQPRADAPLVGSMA